MSSFVVKCDDCKKTIKKNVSFTESVEGGRCKKCKKKGFNITGLGY